MPETVKPKKIGRSVSLMIWGAFVEEIRGPFLIFTGIEGSVTAEYYLKEMQEILPRFMEHIADTLNTDTIFMQDNASIYKAGIVKNWLRV